MCDDSPHKQRPRIRIDLMRKMSSLLPRRKRKEHVKWFANLCKLLLAPSILKHEKAKNFTLLSLHFCLLRSHYKIFPKVNSCFVVSREIKFQSRKKDECRKKSWKMNCGTGKALRANFAHHLSCIMKHHQQWLLWRHSGGK